MPIITEKGRPFCIQFQYLVGRDALTLSRPTNSMSLLEHGV